MPEYTGYQYEWMMTRHRFTVTAPNRKTARRLVEALDISVDWDGYTNYPDWVMPVDPDEQIDIEFDEEN